MIEIIPAILTKNKIELKEKVELIKDHVETIHIDIEDGLYVNNKTLELEEVLSTLSTIDFKCRIEIHMMCLNPDKYIDQLKKVKNIASVVIHRDSTDNIETVLKKIKDTGLNVGLCIGLEEEIFNSDINNIDYFMVLDEIPGFSGGLFNSKALIQINSFKLRFPNILIEADGGINYESAVKCVKSGANKLIINSFIFNDSDPIKKLIEIKKYVNQ